MAGHLFITLGDIRELACSAWLLPTAGNLKVEQAWTHGNARLTDAFERGLCREATQNTQDWHLGSRVALVLDSDCSHGAVWLGNVGGHEHTELSWIVAPVAAFVRQAAEHAAPSAVWFRHQRASPITELPFSPRSDLTTGAASRPSQEPPGWASWLPLAVRLTGCAGDVPSAAGPSLRRPSLLPPLGGPERRRDHRPLRRSPPS